MLFSDIYYLTSEFTVERGYVGVQGSDIVYVDSKPPFAGLAATLGEVYDGVGKLLIPGLYNTHTHAPMTLLRGYAEGLPLQTWLNDKVFPFEAKIDTAAALSATELAIAEMLRFGTVGFTDMYYFNDARIAAIASSGIKANICSGIIVFDPQQPFEGSKEQQLNEQLVREHHNTMDGRLRIDLNIHSEYLSNEHYVRGTGEQASRLGVGTHVHLSETRLEHEQCKERRGGQTPTQYLDALGLFDVPCTAAHCVYTEPEDWAIMAAKNVTAASNPASNLKLGSGVAPLAPMLDAGVNITLGTDGMASNNNHNLFKEIYLAALLSKGTTGDPTLIAPEQALAFATVNGAASQGRLDSGSIAPSKRADLVVLEVDVPWMQPVLHDVNNLVYSAQGSDVVLTMVDGKVLYRDGEWPTIDVERAAAQTQAAAQTIIASL